jgi:hypothetical protein
MGAWLQFLIGAFWWLMGELVAIVPADAVAALP